MRSGWCVSGNHQIWNSTFGPINVQCFSVRSEPTLLLKNGKMSVSAQKQEHVGDWPPWATYSVSGDYAVASFDPCSCQRGKPQKVVRKEVVRFGSRGKGRTADEAKQELIKKVRI